MTTSDKQNNGTVDPKRWLNGDARYNAFGEGEDLSLRWVSQPKPEYLDLSTVPDFPKYIALEMTNACNLSCTHCNYHFGVDHYTRDRGAMKENTVIRVLEEAKEYKIPVMMNYDGEPLMNKNFMNYLKLATEMGVHTYFNTNGTLWTQKFADELISFYRGDVAFSLDGLKDWYEKVRKTNYEKVVQNIEYFLKKNEEAGWPVTVNISFCNLGQSHADRKEFVDRWIQFVNSVSLGEVNDKNGTMISKPLIEMNIKERPVCNVPWETLGIGHNGDVIPCSIYITRANTVDMVFGNVHEQSLKQIWNCDKYYKFRKMLVDKTYQGTYCESCERWRCQFSFPEKKEESITITRNGYWTTFKNMEKGENIFGRTPRVAKAEE